MTINAQRLSDTTRLLYDLGTAHSRTPYKNVNEFAVAIAWVSDDCDLICFTNQSQVKERQYLSDLGFTMDSIQVASDYPQDRMMSHFITAEAFKEKAEKAVSLAEKRKKAEAATLKFFFERRDTSPIKLGNVIGYLSGNYIRDNLIFAENFHNTLYIITTILPSGRVRFKMSDAYNRSYGAEYLNNYTIDQGYEVANCHRIDCTRAEYDAKIKEFMDNAN